MDKTDLRKVSDAVAAAMRHHEHRDEANAEFHLAPTVRYSPLTVELQAALERIDRALVLDEQVDG